MRRTLLYNGLEVIAYNVNRKQSDLKLFEFGKIYFKKGQEYLEKKRLAIFKTGKALAETWHSKTTTVDFHHISEAVRSVLERYDIQTDDSSTLHDYPLDFGIQLYVKETPIVSYGKVKSTVTREFGLKQDVFFADIDWDLFLSLTTNNIAYREVSKYPEVRRDLSLVIDKSISYKEIKKAALNSERQLLRKINVFDVYEGKEIGDDKKAYALSFILQDDKRTLTDKVIDKAMNKMMRLFESELGAVIRQ